MVSTVITTDLSVDLTPLVGYHQKCHTPPIPASALELDTPWNCTYCLRGVKCPYLTESLDVLQNLLSDEESHSHDDVESVTTIESDEGGEEFTSPAVQQYGKFLAPPRPQKKRVSVISMKRAPPPPVVVYNMHISGYCSNLWAAHYLTSQ